MAIRVGQGNMIGNVQSMPVTPEMLERINTQKPLAAANSTAASSTAESAKTLWDGNGKWIVIGIAALLIAGIAYLLIKK